MGITKEFTYASPWAQPDPLNQKPRCEAQPPVALQVIPVVRSTFEKH